MNRMRGTQKQKLYLKKFHRLVRSNFRQSSRDVGKSLLRPRTLLVGLTATIGISSLALAIQQDPHVKSQVIKSSVQSDTKSPDTSQTSTTDVTVKTTPPSANDDSQTATINNGAAEVTINNQPVPIENGEVHQTFTDSNGSVFSVDISVDSSSTGGNSSHSSTDIDISSHSSSDNDTRGSPRR